MKAVNGKSCSTGQRRSKLESWSRLPFLSVRQISLMLGIPLN
ncbi:hypothetical protein BRADI_3g50445v3 [Brachypodium distachyon]|uniref:Uncharacterized protein n=1 Tax=Brachypodium distachyon TaxID=15368 RepID=A0A2K2D4F6_BRADI|nr:hypothetical protein BRADI_3g50445v3 [Brachypodium distachyon]